MPIDPLKRGGPATDENRKRFNEDTHSKAIADQQAITAPKDRVFFNGSSYSGADIKVVVHRYDVGPDEVAKDIRQAIGVYEQVAPILEDIRNNSLSQITSLIQQFKLGAITREAYDTEFKTVWTEKVHKIRGMESAITSVNYSQFIGQYLLSLTILVQGSPTGIESELSGLVQVLNDIVVDWTGILEGVDTRIQGGGFFQTKVLAELQTISISSYREKAPVRALGTTQVKGYTRGPRTVAGSMIFTVFDRNVLFGLLDADPSDFHADDQFSAAILDQLPPMDITITFANEYGSLSRMTLYGVEFVSEGHTMSIEDLLLEDVVQYVARDVDPMTPVTDPEGRQYSEVLRKYNQSLSFLRKPYSRNLTATDLLGSTYGAKDDQENAALTRFRNRFNPFI
jgi:hypothetical protein